MSNFSQGQGNQGTPRKRTSGKPHKVFRRFTQKLRPPAHRSFGSERKRPFLDGN